MEVAAWKIATRARRPRGRPCPKDPSKTIEGTQFLIENELADIQRRVDEVLASKAQLANLDRVGREHRVKCNKLILENCRKRLRRIEAVKKARGLVE
jgi:ElaB/YqjD/DUF883 family membrane-anchored ribosome-binding protein